MEKVLSIHYLRGLAALAVVAFHLRPLIDNVYAQKNLGQLLFSHGDLGVDLFFIISGFIITLATTKKTTNYIIDFVIKRTFRIYPVLIIGLMGIFFLMPNDDLLNIMRSAIPLHLDYAKEAPYFGYNSLITAWTLTYELYFYFIFLIAMTISHKYRAFVCSAILMSIVFISQIYFNGYIDFSGHSTAKIESTSNIMTLIKFSSSPMLLEFVVGMMLYEFRKVVTRIPLANIISFSLTAFVICSFFSGYRSSHGPLNYGAWGVSLLIATLIYDSKHGIKENKALSFLGDISYSLYISHVLVIKFFMLHFTTFPLYSSTSGFSKFLFLMFSSLIISYFMFIFIEKPFIKLGRKVISSTYFVKMRATN
ncbi:acyltransferase [Citrobacter amalonaticus]